MGESGIGKSTVLRLLLRFWNPKSGHIRVNDIPLERVPLEELRRRVAVLEQDTFLFNGTLGENIALGKPDASREEIAEAARAGGAGRIYQKPAPGVRYPHGSDGGQAVRR